MHIKAPRDLQMLLGSVKYMLLHPVAGASLAGAEVPLPLTECIFYRLYYKFQLHYTLITFASFDRLGPYHQNKCSVSIIFSDFLKHKG